MTPPQQPPPPPPYASSAAPQQRPRWFKPVPCIATFLLGVIVVVGVAVLIIWLAVHPRSLVYSVVSATIQNYTLTSTNHLTAAVNFTLEAYNPNVQTSVYYDAMEARLYYDDQQIAAGQAEPFFQPRRNVTHVDFFLPAKDVPLNSDVARELKVDRTNGDVELELRVTAKIRLKVGVWKSGHRKLKMRCGATVLFSSKGFTDSFCEVDL